ncbi:MAG TPA: ATP-binding protein [Solirubrobacterales bacterium]|jgi:anti-sigma regulatory factor (Ser/Thr protein kinase)|nr:ATP-binding protein [Solirubrobacterales bacterium]
MGAADKRRSKARLGGGSTRSIEANERAEPNAIPMLRRRAGDFAATHGGDAALVERVELAVSEVVTNVVKYAYGSGDDGRVELTATASEKLIEIKVADRGCGFLPGDSDGLGIGLTLVAQMSGDLEIAQSPQGTTVTMRFPLAPSAEAL